MWCNDDTIQAEIIYIIKYTILQLTKYNDTNPHSHLTDPFFLFLIFGNNALATKTDLSSASRLCVPRSTNCASGLSSDLSLRAAYFTLRVVCLLMASPGFLYGNVRLSRPRRLSYLVFSLSKLMRRKLWLRALWIDAEEGVNDRDNNLWHRDIRSLTVQLLWEKHTCANPLELRLNQ